MTSKSNIVNERKLEDYDLDEEINTTIAGRIVPGGPHHPRTMLNWIHAGKLKAYRTAGDRQPFVIIVRDLIEAARPAPYDPDVR